MAVAFASSAIEDRGPSELDDFRANTLVHSSGTSFREFRRSLRPRFGVVWRDLLAGHAALAAAAAAAIAADLWQPELMPFAIAAAAIAFGIAHACIQNFFHEAAHYNIASTRAANDRLANLLIGCFTGLDIARYRVVHMAHHRHLGTPEDTERTYFNALNIRFLLEILTGIQVLRVFIGRLRHLRSRTVATGAGAKAGGHPRRQLAFALTFNGGIVIGAAVAGLPSLAAGWAIGLAMVYPLLGAVRQLLEHRSETADGRVDYSAVPHGTVNRMFGAGPFASVFGSAGFNRHLLHHWEPQISYTRLPEVEAFLRETAAAEAIECRRTTYWRTFAALLRARRPPR